jgi:hypothetical protein
MDPISHKYTGRPFPMRNPEGRVAPIIEVEKLRYTKLPLRVHAAEIVAAQETGILRFCQMTCISRNAGAEQRIARQIVLQTASIKGSAPPNRNAPPAVTNSEKRVAQRRDRRCIS